MHEIHFDAEGATVRIAFQGDVHPHDILRAMEEISEDGLFRCSHRLWDFRDCALHLSGEDFRRLGDEARARQEGSARVVFLVDRDLSFGILRIQQVYREDDSTELLVERDERQAMVWLRAG